MGIGKEAKFLDGKFNSVPFESPSCHESLFTSPELLAECRNFLKFKSGEKSSNWKADESHKVMVSQGMFEPLKLDFIEGFQSEAPKLESRYHSEKMMVEYSSKTQCEVASPLQFPFSASVRNHCEQ
jgi:hypothetical protein